MHTVPVTVLVSDHVPSNLLTQASITAVPAPGAPARSGNGDPLFSIVMEKFPFSSKIDLTVQCSAEPCKAALRSACSQIRYIASSFSGLIPAVMESRCRVTFIELR